MFLGNRYSGRTLEIAGDRMINQPTITPSDGTSGNVAPAPTSSPYFSLQVVNTAGTVARAVIFDASQGYQLDMNYVMPLTLTITGVTNHYQFMLNDLAHVAKRVDTIQLDCTPGTANAQFARPIQVYECMTGSMPSLVRTLYPNMGKSEAQFQANIITFPADLIITNRTVFVVDIVGNTTLNMNFYQIAEVGRKN